ncbi:MAG: tubulin-like doman-containing protein [Anaerolineae bacterium]|nr:tubulin-like doman-containing protein [Anaerolineae bacterium]
MPRPTFVIGVGGTGSWVLSWLKKDLVETHGSLEGLPVRLLLLDTAPNMTQVDYVDTQGGSYSEFIRLSDEEFIHLPSQNAGGLSATETINNGVINKNENLSHFYNWFCGGYFPAASLNLAVGAAQFRQLGRLSLVQGLHMTGSADQVYQRMRTAMDQAAREVGNQRSLDVHVAGSFAGGTGSGMFLDVAWLVRAIAKQLNIRLFLTGFFAMPSVFGQPREERLAKAFCAWRELNRMMTIRRIEGNGFRLKWGNQPQVIYDVEEVVYDHVYLVDPMRAGQRMPSNPADGVFPVMAEAISFIMDAKAGDRYVQHILQNLNNRKVQNPFKGRPTYSTFYARAWKVPVHHQLARYQHKFALEFLRRLLDVEEYQVPDAAGNMRTEYRLRDQSNARVRVSEIFTEVSADVGNTNFILLLDKIRTTPSNERNAAIDEFASAALDLLSMYAQMPETPDGLAVQQQIDQYVNWQVPAFDKGRDPLEQLISIHNNELHGPDRVGAKVRDYFGDFTADQFRGKLYDVLQAAQDLHTRIFARRLVNWARRALNDRYGLSIVLTVLRQLKADLVKIEDFMVEAQRRQPDANATDNDARIAYQEAWEVAHKGMIAGLLGQKANAVRRWLEIEAENVRVRRSRRALQRMIETVREIRSYVENIALPKVEAMEKQLVTDSTVSDTVGLYRSLHLSLQDEMNRLALDKRLKDVISLLGDVQADVPVDDRQLEELIGRTQWTLDDQMNIAISIQIDPDPSQPPITLTANLRDPKQTRELVKRILRNVASKYTPPLADEKNRASKFITVEQLAGHLQACRPTLFEQSAVQTVQDLWTFYVRMDSTPEEQKALSDRIDQLGITKENSDSVVSSENPYKIVVFSARELLLPENFAAWETCQSGYQVTVIGDRDRGIPANGERVRCDHLFAAEKNALTLEMRIANNDNLRRQLKIGALMPTLNPRIVHLLEHKDRLEHFVKAWLFGWIKRVDTGSDGIWQLEAQHLGPVDICSDSEDMLSVIARFVFASNLRNLEHDRLRDEVRETWESWKRTPERGLLGLLDFELAMCDTQSALDLRRIFAPNSTLMTDVLKRDTFEQVCADKAKQHLDKATAQAGSLLPSAVVDRIGRYIEAPYRQLPLAHQVLSDLSRLNANSQPLVADAEAHLQFVNIVLRLTLMDLYNNVSDHIHQRHGH